MTIQISELEGLKRRAQKDGWAQFIRTPVDERALLKGHTFDFARFDHFRKFIDNFIKLTKGKWAGQPMTLLPWHETICGSLFGWVKPDGLRRFRRAYIEVPKKNSKTTLFGSIGLYMLAGDGEASSEVYTCANEREQAGILWGIAAEMVRADEDLSEQIKIIASTKTLLLDTSSWFRAWSSDHTGKDGPDAHCILVDELHEWKGNISRDFFRKIRYAGIARAEPLCPLIITTAGDDRYSLCYEQHCAAENVIRGTSEDLQLFACIYGANPEKIKADPDYWKTEECWKEANPSYGLILSKDDFEADVREVETDPTAKAGFLRYRLGVWIDSDSPWLPTGIWEKNTGAPIEEKDLADQLCFAGLDLSSVHDFTAAAYVFPYKGALDETATEEEKKKGYIKKFRAIVRIYCPEDTFAKRAREDRTGSFRTWFEQGYIRLTPGDSIDHDFIYTEIERDAGTFQVLQLAYDRNSAAWIIQEIQKKIPHVELFPFNQSMVGMSSPTKALTASLHKARIEHGGNPVLAWMAANAVTETNNAQENMMLHKGKSKDKIDGIVAMIMGYNQAELGFLRLEKKFSPYSNAGFARIKKIEGIQGDKKGTASVN